MSVSFGKPLALKAALAVLALFSFFLVPTATQKAEAQQVIQKIEALVNDQVISAHDVSERMGLVLLATGQTIQSEDQLVQLRQQVLESLVNETLQVQEALEFDVPIPESDVMSAYTRVASSYNRTQDTFDELLRSFGSSSRAIIRQISAEYAWQTLVNGRYGSYVTVTDDEIEEILDEMKRNEGMQEFRVSEIFLSIDHPSQAERVASTAQQIRDQIQSYVQFPQVARQFSQSTTAAQGGDLGWVRAGQMPDQVEAVVKMLDVLTVSNPIKTPGGYYIVALTDRRKIMGVDPLDELLELKQLGWFFTEQTSEEEALAWYQNAEERVLEFDSCDNITPFAESLGQNVMAREIGEVPLKQLNPELRTILRPIEANQASPPINTPDGFIIFIVCNRRMPATTMPAPEEIESQMEQQRIALMAQRYLRDLRRDAIIDYK